MDQHEAAARERDFDDALGPQLSREEQRILADAENAEAERRRRTAARRIIAEAMFEAGEPCFEAAGSGEVVAKLYATWSPATRSEPIVECAYANTGIYADLEGAMSAHGIATFPGRCQEIGQRLVLSVMAQIFATHEALDARAAEEMARDMIAAENRRICE